MPSSFSERAVLVTVVASQKEVKEAEMSLDELARLLDTAGGVAVCRLLQIKERFDPATGLGKGKVEELRDLCRYNDCHLVIFDFELSPSQIRNLEDITGCTVIDRTMLILDIFALHAVTGEGKLQVELAQLRYTAPRLQGKGLEMSRQGGGIGSRGPGESRLETDRRHIRRRIEALSNALLQMEHTRSTMRMARDRSGIPKVAIVGYTNAGKSTLLNRLTDAGVLSENKLFATLDPTTRQLLLPEGEKVLLTDTVGLIRRLPHHLIKAFHSTLEEAAMADILLILVDASDPECEEKLAVTEKLLTDLSAGDKPRLVVYNKCDLLPEAMKASSPFRKDALLISAESGQGIPALLQALLRMVREGKVRAELFFPYEKQNLLSLLHTAATVETCEYRDNGIAVTAILDRAELGRFRPFLAEADEAEADEAEEF